MPMNIVFERVAFFPAVCNNSEMSRNYPSPESFSTLGAETGHWTNLKKATNGTDVTKQGDPLKSNSLVSAIVSLFVLICRNE